MIAFVVPVHGRHALAEACLRQLSRVCSAHGDATAFVVGTDSFFADLAEDLGFFSVVAGNAPLGRKWNDGFQAAAEAGADYLIPFGSDDVIDGDLLTEPMPADDEIRCSRSTSIVSPDGAHLAELQVLYPGGDGVRVWPRAAMEKVGFRPADDRRDRGIDGSMTDRMLARTGRRPNYVYVDLHPLQIIDFKTNAPDQRTSFATCVRGDDPQVPATVRDVPWGQIAAVHSPELVSDLQAVYELPVAA